MGKRRQKQLGAPRLADAGRDVVGKAATLSRRGKLRLLATQAGQLGFSLISKLRKIRGPILQPASPPGLSASWCRSRKASKPSLSYQDVYSFLTMVPYYCTRFQGKGFLQDAS